MSGVDVLVNHAGVMTPGLLAEADDEQFGRHSTINVRDIADARGSDQAGKPSVLIFNHKATILLQ